MSLKGFQEKRALSINLYQSRFSPETKPIGYVYIDTYQSRCFIGISSCCSRDWEVPQSDLLSANWRSRKASAWFSLSQICWNLGGGWRWWSKAQETTRAKVLRTGDVGISAQAGNKFALPLPFCSAEILNYWVMLDPTREDSLLDAVCWCIPNLFWRCPYRHTRKSNVLLSIWASP